MSSSSSSLSSTIRILNLWSSSTLCENPLVRCCVLSISVTYGPIMSLLFISSVSSFAYCFLSVGILTVKTVPCSTTLWQSMLPWCSLTRSWVNDRPMPVPVVFFACSHRRETCCTGFSSCLLKCQCLRLSLPVWLCFFHGERHRYKAIVFVVFYGVRYKIIYYLVYLVWVEPYVFLAEAVVVDN